MNSSLFACYLNSFHSMRTTFIQKLKCSCASDVRLVAFIEGYVDRNSFFCRLELPDGIMPLCVKVKPEQSVRLFLEPILSRQGLPSDHVMVHLVSTFLF